MKLTNNLIRLSAIGFGVGLMTGVLVTAISSSAMAGDGHIYLTSLLLIDKVGSPVLAFIIQAIVSGIYGILSIGGTVVYGIEEWGFAKSTAIHYILTMTGFYLMAFTLYWFTKESLKEAFIMFLFMTLGYIMIWMINFLVSKAQIAKINRALEAMQQEDL